MAFKILIVEDNEFNCTLLKDILTFHEYEVTVATNGFEGVALARTLKPDLIFMDIQMPGIDGITAGHLLKESPETSGLKIIALTSFAMEGDRGKLMAAGFYAYLSKPIDTRELPILLKSWLNVEVAL